MVPYWERWKVPQDSSIILISCKALTAKEQRDHLKCHKVGGLAEALEWNTGHCDCSPRNYWLFSGKDWELSFISNRSSRVSQSKWFIFWPDELGFGTNNNKTIWNVVGDMEYELSKNWNTNPHHQTQGYADSYRTPSFNKDGPSPTSLSHTNLFIHLLSQTTKKNILTLSKIPKKGRLFWRTVLPRTQ